jgi:peptidyl-prolyl cis-trans isomerase B (cyclophilin B)
LFLLPLPASQAAERPQTVDGCAAPTSKVRTPGTLKQPKSVDKKLATTMTITTNCGVITIAMNPAAPQTLLICQRWLEPNILIKLFVIV